jgi:hypothetical protein
MGSKKSRLTAFVAVTFLPALLVTLYVTVKLGGTAAYFALLALLGACLFYAANPMFKQSKVCREIGQIGDTTDSLWIKTFLVIAVICWVAGPLALVAPLHFAMALAQRSGRTGNGAPASAAP